MPTYTVRDPKTGHAITLKGDSPPTEAELTQIFDRIGAMAPPQTPDAQIAAPQPKDGGMTDEKWAAMTTPEKIKNGLMWGGRVISSITGMNGSGQEALDHPGMTLATAAVPLVAGKVLSALPSKAKAGEGFRQVAATVGDKPVDLAGAPGQTVMRITEMSERGSTMPKAVRDLLKRATDPNKGDIPYSEMRDFYSNISRLSADEYQRLTPPVKMELGKLRVALNAALRKTAESGGVEKVYDAAMKQYAVAARLASVAEKVGKEALKYGATAAGAGALYGAYRAVTN